ncbi:hypothetical protein [Eubacterium limosum]|uniref:hypothetical protein n=1 Tax=Eubacterium limosum TaxID=1736 RepID=UPI001062B0BA|nr:hypothetical protein [Eubacterium limosum]
MKKERLTKIEKEQIKEYAIAHSNAACEYAIHESLERDECFYWLEYVRANEKLFRYIDSL